MHSTARGVRRPRTRGCARAPAAGSRGKALDAHLRPTWLLSHTPPSPLAGPLQAGLKASQSFRQRRQAQTDLELDEMQDKEVQKAMRK